MKRILRWTILLALLATTTLCAEDIKVFDLTAEPPVEKDVSGEAAEKVITDFNELDWDGTPGARCHHPAYRIISPAKGETILDVSVCFACWNVRYITPERPVSGFKKDSLSARTLHDTLRSIFKKTEQGAAANP